MNLFIDTSNSYILFSIFNEYKVVASQTIKTEKNQAEIFINSLQNFLNEYNLNLEKISNFFFTSGPGSFTGVRVALSFAKALYCSDFTNIYTISSLDILVDNYNNCKTCIDARGNKYYYLEVKNNVFSPYQIKVIDEININECNTYENQLDNIPLNVLNLVNKKKFSNSLEPVYLKGAF